MTPEDFPENDLNHRLFQDLMTNAWNNQDVMKEMKETGKFGGIDTYKESPRENDVVTRGNPLSGMSHHQDVSISGIGIKIDAKKLTQKTVTDESDIGLKSLG